jgi:hypothetical protein
MERIAVEEYYRRIARDADTWAMGLTAINGGENLLRMAAEFDDLARDAQGEDDMRVWVTLAAALRRHVEGA